MTLSGLSVTCTSGVLVGSGVKVGPPGVTVGAASVAVADMAAVAETPTGVGVYFVGDYEGLTTVGRDFVAAWSQPHDNDLDSVFVRRVGP